MKTLTLSTLRANKSAIKKADIARGHTPFRLIVQHARRHSHEKPTASTFAAAAAAAAAALALFLASTVRGPTVAPLLATVRVLVVAPLPATTVATVQLAVAPFLATVRVFVEMPLPATAAILLYDQQ